MAVPLLSRLQDPLTFPPFAGRPRPPRLPPDPVGPRAARGAPADPVEPDGRRASGQQQPRGLRCCRGRRGRGPVDEHGHGALLRAPSGQRRHLHARPAGGVGVGECAFRRLNPQRPLPPPSGGPHRTRRRTLAPRALRRNAAAAAAAAACPGRCSSSRLRTHGCCGAPASRRCPRLPHIPAVQCAGGRGRVLAAGPRQTLRRRRSSRDACACTTASACRAGCSGHAQSSGACDFGVKLASVGCSCQCRHGAAGRCVALLGTSCVCLRLWRHCSGAGDWTLGDCWSPAVSKSPIPAVLVPWTFREIEPSVGQSGP